MNKVLLVGRISQDLELRRTTNNNDYLMFNVAINRRYTNANGERQADFVNCVAWDRTAKFITTYFEKGSLIGIVGRIQTRNYDNANGQRVYVTEILVEEVEFVGAKSNNSSKITNNTNAFNTSTSNNEQNNDPFFADVSSDLTNTNDILSDLDISDDELPF